MRYLIIIFILLFVSYFVPSNSIVFNAKIAEAHEKHNSYDILLAIIQCESSGNPNAFHINKNGSIDYGLLQVNTIHKPRMEKLGLNIENPTDNFAFGLMLYKDQGVKPLKASAHCWLKTT